jgi:hypothetical protein
MRNQGSASGVSGGAPVQVAGTQQQVLQTQIGNASNLQHQYSNEQPMINGGSLKSAVSLTFITSLQRRYQLMNS